MFNFKRMLWGMLLGLLHLPVNANNATPGNDVSGWFVGGAFGYVEFDGEYNMPYWPLVFIEDSSFDRDAASLSVYGGYHFNKYFGIEGAIRDSGNLSDSGFYDASVNEIAITPKITVPIGRRFSFYAKGGVVLASYVEVLDRTLPGADDELYWGGIGLTAGVGMQALVAKNIILRLSYDYSDIEFEPVEDSAYSGVVFYWVPEIDATLARTAIGVHYQF